MWGKEKYSKEGYENLEKKTTEAKEASDVFPGTHVSTGVPESYDYGDGSYTARSASRFIPSPQRERFDDLTKKLERMKNAGHKEALELEAKHNQLLQEVVDAHQALDEFEKEQLGMDRE